MRYLMKYKIFEKININKDEINDILLDLKDDGFDINIFDHPNRDYNSIFIDIKIIHSHNLSDYHVKFTWSDIKETINRIIIYLNENNLLYSFLLVDTISAGHRFTLSDNKIVCNCQKCECNIPHIDINENITSLRMCIYEP